MNSGILVVAAERELRRMLFDALDLAGHPSILSARDITHAAILLEGRPALQLMIAVFSGDEAQAVTRCRLMRQLPGGANTPLIAIVTREASFDPSDLPEMVTDWLHASHIDSELVPRWRRAQVKRQRLSALAPVDAPTSSGSPGAQTDYRYVFEEGDNEWLIADPLSHRVIEVSPTVAVHSHVVASRWIGVPLDKAILFEGVSIEQVLTDADRLWYPCQRKSAQGADTGQASARRIQHGGRDAVA